MGRYKTICIGFCLFLVLSLVLETFVEAGSRIQIIGSTTVLPVASRSAKKFMKFSSSRILVNAGGSGVGIHSVAGGRADIGMASRGISKIESERFENVHMQTHPVGIDAVACVVSSEIYQSGVQQLTTSQIAGIYLGKIRNWSEVGGPNRKILVVDKERHRGTRHVFMRYVFGNPLQRTPGTLLVTGSNNEEQAKIAQSDSAIGMLSFAWINDDVKAVSLVDEGKEILPTWESARLGIYPIIRKLNFITAGEPKGDVKAFIDFVKGPEGQQIVKDSGYIPVGSYQQ